jgi:hypothetical protein
MGWLCSVPIYDAWISAIVTLIVLMPGAAWAGAPVEGHMVDIVRNVRANEGLYKNREVLADYKYDLGNPSYPLGGYCESTEGNYRIVTQDGLSYVKAVLPQPTLNGGKGNANTLQGWDGTVTRAVEQEAYCNLIKGERNDDYRFYLLNPHTILLWRGPTWLKFPLSDYLSGGSAVRSKMGAEHDNVKAIYVGEEVVGGLSCSKIRCLIWLDGFQEPRVEGGEYHDIWYPHRFEVTVYDDARFIKDKKLEILCRETYTIKTVDLHPHYDISLFRNIEFPKDLPLYTIENGQIVEHRKAILPEEPTAAMGYTGWIIAIVTASLIAFSSALFWVWKTRSRRSSLDLGESSILSDVQPDS